MTIPYEYENMVSMVTLCKHLSVEVKMQNRLQMPEFLKIRKVTNCNYKFNYSNNYIEFIFISFLTEKLQTVTLYLAVFERHIIEVLV